MNSSVFDNARPSQADVELEYGETHVRLTVRDDGTTEASAPGQGFGLIGVQERARLVGGELEIRRSPGFALTLTIPA